MMKIAYLHTVFTQRLVFLDGRTSILVNIKSVLVKFCLYTCGNVLKCKAHLKVKF